MARCLPLMAIFAWALLQVPMLVCSTPCGTSMSALYSLAGHSCHRTDSEVHKRCCQYADSESRESDAPAREAPPGGDSSEEHFILRFEGVGASAGVSLPPRIDVDSFAAHTSFRIVEQHGATPSEQEPAHGPPVVASPVTRGDQLRL